MTRDTANAVALGMTVGTWLAVADEQEAIPEGIEQPSETRIVRPKRWQNIGWDQIVTDVDEAAKALDVYQAQQPADFWEEYDWYLTLDAIADDLFKDPNGDWSDARIVHNLVKL